MSKKNILVLTVLITLIVGLFIISLTQIGDPANSIVDEQSHPIKIGFILTITGWGDYWGQGALRGVKLAENDIGKQYDSNFNFIVEDSKTNNQESGKAAQKLISLDKVDALYAEFSGPSSVISPIAKAHGKPLVFNAFPSSIISDNPASLKMYFDPYMECKKLAEYAISQGQVKQAVVLVNLAYTESCLSGIKQGQGSTGAQTILQELFPLELTDFKTILKKTTAAEANVIIMIGYEDHALNFIKQKNELGIDIPIYCGGKNDCLTSKVIDSFSPESLEKFVTFNFNIQPEFSDRYKALFPGATELDIQAAAGAYDGAMYLFRALHSCPERDVNCVVKFIKSDNEYRSMIISHGFDDNRIFQMQSQIEVFREGKFIFVE